MPALLVLAVASGCGGSAGTSSDATESTTGSSAASTTDLVSTTAPLLTSSTRPGDSPFTPPGEAGPLPGDATIVFQERVPGADKIAIQFVGGDGSGQRVAADDLQSGLQRHGDWSPDGTSLVFTASDDGGSDDLWIMSADGTGLKKVVECDAPCLGADEAAWSPDGRSIVFSRLVQPGDVATSSLEVLDVATGTATVLFTAPPNTALLAPRWAPDGRRLAVEWLTLDGPGAEASPVGDLIGILDLDQVAAGVQPVTEADQWANNPDWSKDGDWLVYAARVPGKGTFQDLYMSRPDGTDVRRITTTADDGDMAVQPTFTPDGRFVLFVVKPDGGFEGELAVVEIGTGAVDRIGGANPVGGEHPRLRPQP